MKKPHKKFDPEMLYNESIPNDRGQEGEHPLARLLKQKHQKDPEKAHVFFADLHDRHGSKPEFAWLERIRDKKFKP